MNVIGYFTWWTIHDVKLERDKFRDLLAKHNLPTSYLDEEKETTRLRKAFLKAQRKVKTTQSKEFLIRKISKNKDQYVFGLVDEKINKKEKHLDYNHSATMIFDPETGNINCDMPHRAFDAVKENYEIFKDFVDSDDVREVILDIIQGLRRVSVRGRGGFYFVHESYEKILNNIRAMVAEVGDSSFEMAPQIDVESTKKAIYKAFVADLRNKISDFQAELENETLTRKSAFANRLQEFKDLREEISFYTQALSFQAEDLDNELANLQKKVEAKISE